MKKYAIDLQLDPPHTYRHNVAEREIRTCKNNFISGLSKIYPDSPISEWNRLLSKCLITLCLPRNSRARPYLSAHTYLFGLYDFNKYLMEPPVTRMIVNRKPDNRTSWGHHGTKGWYIGPSLDNYKCMQCYMPITGIVKITDTLQYIPK